jgi:hypothetical protein
MTDKTHLKTTMLALRAEQLRFAEQSYARYLAGAAGRGDEGGEAGASSQAHNSAVLAQSFECPIHTHEHALAAWPHRLGPKDEVTEGAAVNIGGRWFVIGVATDAFECDGHVHGHLGGSAHLPGDCRRRRR